MSEPTPIEVALPRRGLAVLAVAAGVVALTAPGWAGPTARIILVAVGALAAAAGAVAMVRSIPFAGNSRFEPSANRRTRREVPPELETLTRAVRSAKAPTGRQVLDPVVLLHVRRLATARLVALHFDLDDPDDHPAIRRHVSADLWALLTSGPAGGRTQHLPSSELPATSLPALLDELERL